ncbi:MAG: NADH-quinone oxidoreductase subunit C [Bryobacteraceae bacterium]
MSGKVDRSETTLEIQPGKIVAACRQLKEGQQFERLADLTAVDWHPREPRYEVVYHLHSVSRNQRLRLKCRLAGHAAEIDSVTSVWRSANWHEREVFDLFGIRFHNHPNLHRIMLPEDWEGHPLRKDYPVYGNKYGYKDE